MNKYYFPKTPKYNAIRKRCFNDNTSNKSFNWLYSFNTIKLKSQKRNQYIKKLLDDKGIYQFHIDFNDIVYGIKNISFYFAFFTKLLANGSKIKYQSKSNQIVIAEFRYIYRMPDIKSYFYTLSETHTKLDSLVNFVLPKAYINDGPDMTSSFATKTSELMKRDLIWFRAKYPNIKIDSIRVESYSTDEGVFYAMRFIHHSNCKMFLTITEDDIIFEVTDTHKLYSQKTYETYLN